MTNDKIDNIIKSLLKEKPINSGLMRGEAGLILGLFYYSRYYKDEEINCIALQRVEMLYHSLATTQLDHTYASGFSGIYWTIVHLYKNNFISCSDIDSFVEEIESSMIRALFIELESGNFDFLHGAIGIANALLELPKNDYLCNSVVEYIEKHAIAEADDCFKWTDIKAKNGKVFNFGISHGMTSVIVYLSKVYEKRKDEKILKMINSGIKYILKHKQDSIIQFPSVIHQNGQPANYSRLGWCYGDLGIGIALLFIGKRIENKKIQNEAIKILEMSTLRKLYTEINIKDASLCHGTSGIAYIYHKSYCETGISLFKKSSLYWLEQTLQMSIFEDGYAGYKSYFGSEGWVNELGFLEGITGILLSILAITHSDKINNWGQALLIG